jgi:hypothetical protein
VAGRSGQPAPPCAARRKDGEPCTSVAIAGSRFCAHHGKAEVERAYRELMAGGFERVGLQVPRLGKPLADFGREELLALGEALVQLNPDVGTAPREAAAA